MWMNIILFILKMFLLCLKLKDFLAVYRASDVG